MSSFSDYLENAIANHILGGPDFTRPASVFIRLSTTIVKDDGTGLTEPVGGNYAPLQVTNNDTNWPNASNGVKRNGTKFTFNQASAAWGTIVSGLIEDDAPTPSMLYRFLLRSDRRPFTGAASTDFLTAPGHVLVTDDPVVVRGSNLPGGLSEDVIYYARDISGATFKLAASPGGAAIDLTTDGAGIMYELAPKAVGENDTPEFDINALEIFHD